MQYVILVHEYDLSITTADTTNSGTDCDVYAIVFGSEGQDRVDIENAGRRFDRNGTDVIRVIINICGTSVNNHIYLD
jgi:hypothetical protein